MAETFQCSVVTPEREVLSEDVNYASVPAWDGLVGVMQQRAPLLLKLGDGVLRLDFPQGGSRSLFIGGGFAQMRENRLSVLTAEAIPAEEVVRQDIEAALREAEARVALSDEEVARKAREISRAKALLAIAETGKR